MTTRRFTIAAWYGSISRAGDSGFNCTSCRNTHRKPIPSSACGGICTKRLPVTTAAARSTNCSNWLMTGSNPTTTITSTCDTPSPPPPSAPLRWRFYLVPHRSSCRLTPLGQNMAVRDRGWPSRYFARSWLLVKRMPEPSMLRSSTLRHIFVINDGLSNVGAKINTTAAARPATW